MKTALKFLLLVVLLNVVRYHFGFHFNEAVQPFYLYGMLDALLLFPIVAVANGLISPKLFP